MGAWQSDCCTCASGGWGVILTDGYQESITLDNNNTDWPRTRRNVPGGESLRIQLEASIGSPACQIWKHTLGQHPSVNLHRNKLIKQMTD